MSDGRVRYVRNEDVRLAYRAYGEGETTLVWVPTMFSSIDRYDPRGAWAAYPHRYPRRRMRAPR